MSWTAPLRKGELVAPSVAAMPAPRAQNIKAGSAHATLDRLSGSLSALPFRRPVKSRSFEGAPPLNALLLLRSHMNAIYALCLVFLGALAVSTLKISVPNVMPGFELLLFGWIGVALGRLTGAPPLTAAGGADAEVGAKSDRVDAILRTVAKLLQAQTKASDAFETTCSSLLPPMKCIAISESA